MRRIALALLLSAFLACGGDDGSGPSVETGSIAVSVATTGQSIPASFTVSIDGSPVGLIAANGGITVPNLATGAHTVELEVTPNCSVSGSNPVVVSVLTGSGTSVAFTSQCEGVGALEVSVSTGGSDPDADGYTIRVDGVREEAVGISGGVVFEDLAVGQHSVQLDDVSPNCSVAGPNPRQASVPLDGTADVAFSVNCLGSGTLSVGTTTSGEDPDPNGYSIFVDGANAASVGSNGSVSIPNILEGNHVVELRGIASNCAVAGNNPRTLAVTVEATTQTTFNVQCQPIPGSLTANAVTSGASPDPDGYAVTLDGTFSQAVGTNGSTTFANVPVGDHDVMLSEVASNCTVEGENPRTVAVASASTAQTTFTIFCEQLIGDIEVVNVTSGNNLDDSYTVSLDGGAPQNIAANGSITFSGLPVGSHTLQLSDVAANCVVAGDNPRTVTVQANSATSTQFEVTCTAG